MFDEYDLVIAERDLSKNVKKGCVGTILIVFSEPSIAYEIEFIAENGDTLDVLTVYPNDIKEK